MRTLKEIKDALDRCISDDKPCTHCAYDKFEAFKLCIDMMLNDARNCICELEAKVPKWVNPKEKLPKVPKGFKFIEVLCLYDHDGWKHCELLRFYDKKDEEFKFEPGWHQLDMFDPIMDYEDGMIGWMYLPGFPVPPEEEEAMLTEQFIANK